MIPVVMVWSRPRGFPMAKTTSLIRDQSESPVRAYGSFAGADLNDIFSIAMQSSGRNGMVNQSLIIYFQRGIE
jgi:hypothetical protein